MREALFVLLVVLLLLALTAVKYRKQIAGMIGFARMLRGVKADLTQQTRHVQSHSESSIPLVNCAKCGVWVPQTKARKVGDLFYCSDACLEVQKSAR